MALVARMLQPRRFLLTAEPVLCGLMAHCRPKPGHFDGIPSRAAEAGDPMLGAAVNRQPGFRRGTRRAKQHREEQLRWLAGWLASCWLGLNASAGVGPAG